MNTITSENKVIFNYIGEGVGRVYNLNSDELLNNEVFDTSLFDIIYPEDVEYVKNTVRNALDYNASQQADFRILMMDNTINWIHGEDSPKTQPDGTIFRFCSFMNVSEMKKKEYILRDL